MLSPTNTLASTQEKRPALRRAKRLSLALILLDAAATIIILAVGVPLPTPALSPRHPRMTSNQLEQQLNAQPDLAKNTPTRSKLTYRCSIDPSGGWDYTCRKGTTEIGYYNVSHTAITRRSVIQTHGNQIKLISPS